MNIKLLADKALVKQAESETKSKGGIVIPDTAKEKPQKGKVVAVGPGKRTKQGLLQHPEVKSGDLVLFEKYSGQEIKYMGQEYILVSESNILAILN